MQIDIWTWILSIVKLFVDAFENERPLTENEKNLLRNALNNNPAAVMAVALGQEFTPFSDEKEEAEKTLAEAKAEVERLEGLLSAARGVLREAKGAVDMGGRRNFACHRALKEATNVVNTLSSGKVDAYFPFGMYDIEVKRQPKPRGKQAE